MKPTKQKKTPVPGQDYMLDGSLVNVKSLEEMVTSKKIEFVNMKKPNKSRIKKHELKAKHCLHNIHKDTEKPSP